MKIKESLFSRRTFINNCITATGALVSGSIFYTLIAAILPVNKKKAEPTEIKIPLSELALNLNAAQAFTFGSAPALLIRSEQDELIAVKAVCTHFECLLHYDSMIKQIVCPCHQGFFDIYGNVIKGPPSQSLTRYQLYTNAKELIIIREKNS